MVEYTNRIVIAGRNPPILRGWSLGGWLCLHDDSSNVVIHDRAPEHAQI